MGLSSQSFFHFTSSKGLFGILENGFLIAVSHEVIYNSLSKSVFGIPMVCFCDIPLSVVHKHAKNFCNNGVFGFGLRRKWGEIHLQPVQYYPRQQDNFFQEHLTYLTDLILSNPKILPDDAQSISLLRQLENDSFTVANGDNGSKWVNWLTGLIKPVESKYYIFDPEKDEIVCKDEEYIFYNEREWRHISKKIRGLEIPYIVRENVALYDKNKTKDYKVLADALWQHFSQKDEHLKFRIDDLSWIIVDSEETVDYLIKLIMCSDFKSIGGHPINDMFDKCSLIQKIVPYNRIEGDVFIH